MDLSILTVLWVAETKNLMLYTRRRERRFPLEVCNKGNRSRYHLLAVGASVFFSLAPSHWQRYPTHISGAWNFADNLTWDFIHRKSGSELFPRTWVQLE